jgi:hypothetical protein
MRNHLRPRQLRGVAAVALLGLGACDDDEVAPAGLSGNVVPWYAGWTALDPARPPMCS